MISLALRVELETLIRVRMCRDQYVTFTTPVIKYSADSTLIVRPRFIMLNQVEICYLLCKYLFRIKFSYCLGENSTKQFVITATLHLKI